MEHPTKHGMEYLSEHAFLADEIRPFAAAHDRDGTAPTEALEIFGHAALPRLGIAPGLKGSLDASLEDIIRTFIDIGEGDSSAGACLAMHIAATGFTRHPGLLDEKREVLAHMAKTELFSAPISGTHSRTENPFSFRPTSLEATLDGGEIVLNGTKMFATNYKASTKMLVSAQLGDEAIFLHADTNNPAVIEDEEAWKTTGMRSTRSNILTLNGFHVPEENIILRTKAFEQTFLAESGWWTFAPYTALAFGGAKRTVRLLAQKNNEAHDAILGNAISAIEGTEALFLRGAQGADKDPTDMNSLRRLLAAKLETNNILGMVATDLAEAFGAHGRFQEGSSMPGINPEAERLQRDLGMMRHMPPGSSTVKSVLARLERGLPPLPEIQAA